MRSFSQRAISCFRDPDILRRCAFRFLLKSVEHKNEILEARDINDSKCARRIANADFSDTWTSRPDGFPVVGIESVLNAFELVSSLLSGVLRKGSKPFLRVAKKSHRFMRVYQF
jgi:hypothetical protein